MDNLSKSSLNFTLNSTSSPGYPLNSPSFLVFNVVMLLGVVLPVMAVNTVILVALVCELLIVNIIRLVLGSILVSCLLNALGLAMYQIAGIILYLSQVNNPPTAPCTITVFLIGSGGAARLVFMATFAIVVFIIVKYGEVPKKSFVIVSIIAVVVLWILVFLGASPSFSQAVIHTRYGGSLSCGFAPIPTISYIYVGLHMFFFGLITFPVTITCLAITVFYIKRLTVQDMKLKKAIVKFGFFLLFGNGIYLLAQIVPALIMVTLISPEEASPEALSYPPAVVYFANTLLNVALIPTPILVLVYFKPIRKRLRHWLCCCA